MKVESETRARMEAERLGECVVEEGEEWEKGAVRYRAVKPAGMW